MQERPSDAPARKGRMDKDTYLDDRVRPQIEWWANRARRAKRLHEAFVLASLCMAIGVPVALTLPVVGGWNVALPFAAALGSGASIAIGVTLVMRYTECWVRCEVAAADLAREHNHARMGVGPYRGLSDAELTEVLVARAEDAITRHAEQVAPAGG